MVDRKAELINVIGEKLICLPPKTYRTIKPKENEKRNNDRLQNNNRKQ